MSSGRTASSSLGRSSSSPSGARAGPRSCASAECSPAIGSSCSSGRTSTGWRSCSPCMKVGAVVVPAPVTTSRRRARRSHRRAPAARLVVAARAPEAEIVRMAERPHVLYVDEAQPLLSAHARAGADARLRARATSPSSSPAPGAAGGPHVVDAHERVPPSPPGYRPSTGSTRAAATPSGAPLDTAPRARSGTLCSARGRAVPRSLLHEGEFEPLERLDLIYRLGTHDSLPDALPNTPRSQTGDRSSAASGRPSSAAWSPRATTSIPR